MAAVLEGVRKSMITREIEDRSSYFSGQPLEGWELIGATENRRYRIFYYQDKQGGYHHTAVPLERRYNPYEVHLSERDGMTYARVELKKRRKGSVMK